MLLPAMLFNQNLFDDFFADFPEPDIDKKLYGKHAANIMKTDVKEHDDKFEVNIDLPGFKKDQIKLSLNDGYLVINAEKSSDTEEKDKKGKLIRQERYSGSMTRSFYVGEHITEEDIKAKFENGVLDLEIPKKDPKAIPENNKYIAIE